MSVEIAGITYNFNVTNAYFKYLNNDRAKNNMKKNPQILALHGTSSSNSLER